MRETIGEICRSGPYDVFEGETPVRRIYSNLLSSRRPFATIVDSHGVFRGNIWLNELWGFEPDDLNRSVNSMHQERPKLLEKDHYLTADQPVSQIEREKLRHFQIPVLNSTKEVLGQLDVFDILFRSDLTRKTSQLKGKLGTILIVEDDTDLLSMLTQYLNESGFETVGVTDGKKALECLDQGHQFDIILTDLHMPVMSGRELLFKLKKRDNEVPILVISAYAKPDTLIDCLHLGVSGFIRKPFDLKVLDKQVLNNIRRGQDSNIFQKQVEESLIAFAGTLMSEVGTSLRQKMTQFAFRLSEVLRCRTASIIFYDTESDTLVVEGSTNSKISGLTIDMKNAPVLERVKQTHATWIIDEEDQSSHDPYRSKRYLTHKGMVVPLELPSKKLVGFITAADKISHFGFDDLDNRLILSICGSVALIFEHERLFSKYQTLSASLDEKAKILADRLVSVKKDASFYSRLALLGQLAGSVSHEIANPLAGAMGHVSRIIKREDSIDEVKRRLERVQVCLERISKIVKSVSRLTVIKDETEVKRCPFDLREALMESLSVLEEKIVRHGVELSHEAEKNMMVIGERIQIEQVFASLISAAIDAQTRTKSTPRVQVKIGPSDDQKRALIKILDHRTTEDEDPHHFSSSSGAGEGRQLGVQICEIVIEGHGGKVRQMISPEGWNSLEFDLVLADEKNNPRI